MDGSAVASGSASGAVNLRPGVPQNISIKVTAEDGSTTETYQVVVTRAAASTDATLSALAISSGTLAPVFASATENYTATVANNIANVTLTPTRNQAGATITVDGNTVASGSASAAVALTVGTPKAIPVVVTAEDGSTTKTYTVTVTRVSNDATLSALTISAGALSPAFSASTESYTVSVPFSISSVTLTPTKNQAGATITVDTVAVASGTASAAAILVAGTPNQISIVVTAQDGSTTKTYTVTVTRATPSTDATLSALALSSGRLAPNFSASTTTYTASISSSIASITVTPTVNQAGATITVDGATVASGAASSAVALTAGVAKAIVVVVTAENGSTTQTYRITATRATGPSTDATLNALTLSAGSLSPVFAAGTTSYTAAPPFSAATITVTPTATDDGASITVEGATVASGTASANIALTAGSPKTITIIVTAEDPSSRRTYRIIATRAAASADATLSALAISAGTLAPAFASATTAYTTTLANNVASITLTPTANHPGASITVEGSAVASGEASGAVALTPGTPKIINVRVTAENGSSRIYRLTATRVSTVATLRALALSSGALSPAFSASTESYTANVPNNAASITITPTAADDGATIAVEGSAVTSGRPSAAIALAIGTAKIITITVTAEDATTTKTYRVTATRVSSDAALSALAISPGSISFAASTLAYEVSLANSAASITVTPTARDDGATITVDGTRVASGTASSAVALTAGTPRAIQIVVTAEDGTTSTTYRLTATRARPPGVSVSPTAISIQEGRSAAYSLVLDAAPSGNVTITAASDDTDAATVSPSSLTFTTANWDRPQQVTITTIADDDADPGSATITHMVSGYTVSGFSPVTSAADVVVTIGEGSAVDDLNRNALPDVARVIAANTIGGIAQRTARAGSEASAISFGGRSLAAALTADGEALSAGTLDLRESLDDSKFSLPLGEGTSGRESIAVWGGSEYRNLDGTSGDLRWDGNVFALQTGLDGRLENGVLLGAALTWSRGSLDYVNPDGSGEYEVNITSLNPYAGWSAGRVDFWASAGYGRGDVELRDSAGRSASDLTAQTFGGGASGLAWRRGATSVRIKGEAVHTGVDIKGSAGAVEVPALTVDGQRARLAADLGHRRDLGGGAYAEPSLEAGVRYDGGDGESGTGAELGGGLRYVNPTGGITAEARARILLGRDNYDEWGVEGMVRLSPGARGRGLSFSLQPGYGESAAGGAERVWQGTARRGRPNSDARLDARLGYGLEMRARLLMTPYGEMRISESANRYRAGVRWQRNDTLSLDLAGELHARDTAPAVQTVSLGGTIHF